MANNCGKFVASKFMDQELELFIGLSSEWLSYADGDAQSYTIVVATPIQYCEDSGILTLKNTNGQEFYITEDSIQMFWVSKSGFKLIENTSSTIHSGKLVANKKNKDIM